VTKIGIIGLPQSGGTTVFNALTGAHGEVGGYHGAAHVQLGMVKVPDPRLGRLQELFAPEKTTSAAVEFEDIEGLLAGAGPVRESGAKTMAALRDANGILVVLRCFEDPAVPLAQGSVGPARDLKTIRDELLLADLKIVENRLETIEKGLPRPRGEREALESEHEVLLRCREALESEAGLHNIKMSQSQERMLRSYAFLSLKPMLCILNIGEEHVNDSPRYTELDALRPPPVAFCSKLEMEIMELAEEDRGPFLADLGIGEPASGRIIRACYEMLNLVTFFTYAHDQLRAWPVNAGATAVEAAGKIHSDMAQGFIRAEVVSFDDLKDCGSMQEAKHQGKVRLEGRHYGVRDGDVITFRFSP